MEAVENPVAVGLLPWKSVRPPLAETGTNCADTKALRIVAGASVSAPTTAVTERVRTAVAVPRRRHTTTPRARPKGSMGRMALDRRSTRRPATRPKSAAVAHSTVAHQVQEKTHGDQGQGYEEPHAVEVGLEVDEPPVDRHEPGPDQTHPPIHHAPAQPPRQEHGRQSPEGLERSNGQRIAAGDGDQGSENVRVPRGPLVRGVSNRRIPSGGVGRRRPVTRSPDRAPNVRLNPASTGGWRSPGSSRISHRYAPRSSAASISMATRIQISDLRGRSAAFDPMVLESRGGSVGGQSAAPGNPGAAVQVAIRGTSATVPRDSRRRSAGSEPHRRRR
jgi:hypothetical protein